ncbi:non-hydrolyzing UDP-N-acetylglucosamine 2-epimerase [Streptomyces sp. NP160]|uniref:non-hydrolyzing UDP-N-acetylglucosamine 2-epimerase n=1 Tax=Streptomyces sp. NP160 TaxID=2586637 RepID=UPI00214BC336|nr:UDP-N-acetylglucosamine 2-epimerase (non-hydrolyzing) [Streptomyces sp. NP160]
MSSRGRADGRTVAVVMGTRPEIIKMAPVVHALAARGARARTLLTGQHYDRALAGSFVEACGLTDVAAPAASLAGLARGEQVAAMVVGLSAQLRELAPSAVLVQGDTNSANAGAQAAHYLGLPVVHVEAGLRSGDRGMPEEVNRLLIGALADVHCAPTAESASNLLRAGTDPHAVHVTGNPVVEAVHASLRGPHGPRAAQDVLRRAGLERDDVVLATVHRPENTDDPAALTALLGALGDLPAPVLLPAHPRTTARITAWGLPVPASVHLVEPVDHATFLALVERAVLVVSDSGGLQEEVTVLGRPMVVVRTTTERPESVAAGFCRLSRPAGVAQAAAELLRPEHLARLARTPSPYGDGRAGERIADLALGVTGPLAGPLRPFEELLATVPDAAGRPPHG